MHIRFIHRPHACGWIADFLMILALEFSYKIIIARIMENIHWIGYLCLRFFNRNRKMEIQNRHPDGLGPQANLIPVRRS